MTITFTHETLPADPKAAIRQMKQTLRAQIGDVQAVFDRLSATIEARVAETMNDPEAIAAILPQMMRLREPKGMYRNGGCIDTSREYPKPICSKSGGFVLPDA